MKLWKIFFAIAVISFYFSSPAYAASGESLNAGFVSGIWYSKMPFFVGDQIRIYSAIHNQSGFDLIGEVKFFDGNFLIGESKFSVVSGRVIEEWVDWRVTEGEHSLYVKIVDAQKSVAGKPPEPVTLRFESSGADKQFAGFDTDNDGIGDRDDLDDDGDGVLDDIEVRQNTDPLKQDTDGDGIFDNKDPAPLQASGSASEGVTSKGTVPEETSYDDGDGETSYGDMMLKTVGRVNNFTDSLKKKVEKKEVALRKEIGETAVLSDEGEGNPSRTIVFSSAIKKILKGENIGQNAYLAALSAVAFALENKFVFYSVAFIALFFMLRRIVRFLRPKK